MIIAKSILFFAALIFTVKFIVDVVLRIIGFVKDFPTSEEWHENFVKGYIKPPAYADKLAAMIATWTAFYVLCQVS